MNRVHLHIDRLVLHGVDSQRRDALLQALTAELERQLAAPGALATLQNRHSATLRTPLATAAEATPAQWGSAAAQALLQSLRS